MIYIKTNMPEMPKNCQECSAEIYGCCVIKAENVLGFKKNRPDWCPLVEKKENEE